MSLQQQKIYLPYRLSQIILKLQSIFFKKLVLQKQDLEQTTQVRHYDYQCQGIAILKSFFEKKRQNILMKSFHQIHQAGIHFNNATTKQHKPQIFDFLLNNPQKIMPSVTRRTFFNSTNTVTQRSPIRRILQATQQSVYDQRSCKIKQNQNNLQKLLQKVKKVNEQNRSMHNYKTHNQKHINYIKYMNQEDYERSIGYSNHYHGRYPSHYNHSPKNIYSDQFEAPYEQRKRINTQYDKRQPSPWKNKNSLYNKSQLLSVRNSRRQYILEKFNQLQKNLFSLGFGGGKQEHGYKKLSQGIRNDLISIRAKMQRKTLEEHNEY